MRAEYWKARAAGGGMALGSHSRKGFTLCELGVVIGIMAVVIVLVLPCLGAVRELARSQHCANNIRQLTSGLIAHEGAHQRFPPGAVLCAHALKVGGTQVGNHCAGPNWATAVLPFIDEENNWSLVRECMGQEWNCADDCNHDPWYVGYTTPSVMNCPSAPTTSMRHSSVVTGLEGISKGNYGACYGAWKYAQAIENGPEVWKPAGLPDQVGVDGPPWQDAIGILSVVTIRQRGEAEDNVMDKGVWKIGTRHGTRAIDIGGGMSHTILIGELVPCDQRVDIRGAWTSGAMGAAAFTAFAAPNAIAGVVQVHSQFTGVRVVGGDQIFGCAKECYPLNKMTCKDVGQNGDHYASARSAHAGFVRVAKADGAVSTVSDDIDLVIWQQLASRK